MKAIVYTKYGPPEVLELVDRDKPLPTDDQVLIRVHAATVTRVDCQFRSGHDPFARLFTGLLRPKHTTPGGELAGEVEAVGPGVQHLNPGQRVVGVTSDGFGGHAEYVCLPADAALSPLPPGMSYEEAAAIPYGALTALPFLRDTAALEPGQHVLVNGAAGAIGTWAVQLAKQLGAEVTGVCGTANVELVRSLGADTVIDYTQQDFTRSGRTYDVIFDTVGRSSFARCAGSLTPEGVYVTPVLGLSILTQMARTQKLGRKKAKIAFTGLRSASDKTRDLALVMEWIAAGKVRPVIGRRYAIEQARDAHRHVDGGHKKGNAILLVAGERR